MNRPPKVLHVIPSVGRLRGGPSVTMKLLAKGLADAGLDVHVATTDDDGPGHSQVPLGRPVTEEGVVYWYFRRQTRFYAISWPLTRWLARHVGDYDLVHTHALFSYATLPASVYAARAAVPFIIRPLGTLNRWGIGRRHPILKRISLRLIERRILAHAARVHYTSEQERFEAAEIGVGVPSIVIPLGLDTSAFESRRPPGWLQRNAPHLVGRTILLFLARLDPIKALDLLLPAFAALRADRPDVALVVAGDGEADLVARLREQASGLGIDNDLYWAGFLHGPEKLAALAEADVFVLPSYSESFGLSVVEAMASGLPVIVSDRVAIQREVEAAGAGVVVPCETQRLIEAMALMVADPQRRKKFGEAGRRLAEARFSLRAMTTSLLEAYGEIIVPSTRTLGGGA